MDGSVAMLFWDLRSNLVKFWTSRHANKAFFLDQRVRMFYHLSLVLKNYYSLFNVIHYISFRSMAALLTALFFSFLFGSKFIRHSQRWFRSASREHTPEGHRLKDGMPTMGGLFILFVTLVTSFLWLNWARCEVWIFLGTLIGYGAIGLWDDLSKIRHKKGIKEKHKFMAQVLVGVLLMSVWYFGCSPNTELCIPFIKAWMPAMGVLIVPWAVFLLVGTSNAVNLTDGLDGLAIGSLITNFGTFTALLYISGHALFAQYLHIPFSGDGEIAVIGATLVGASLGFLWYNAHPAQIFMGDVGSLALGAALALMAIMSRQELLLPIAGGLFVGETLSVMAQVLSFKLRGKRIFKMAPIHHHFELLGWPEAKITVRFGIITVILCLIALMTLKLR